MRCLYFSIFLKNKETFNTKSIEHYPFGHHTGQMCTAEYSRIFSIRPTAGGGGSGWSRTNDPRLIKTVL
jgi:hypothetical protein